ncbi:MAG: caspase family protein, partial [Thermodesulfobacteriota bacterium]
MKQLCMVFFLWFIAACAATPEVRLSIPGTGMEINQPARMATRIAVSPRGNMVLVGSVKHAAVLWDIFTGRMINSFKTSSDVGAYAAFVDVNFTPDGRQIIVHDNRMTIWDAETGRELKTFSVAVGNMAMSPDGRSALVVGPKNQTALSLVDPGTGQVIKKLKGHEDSGWRGALYAVDISPDGKYGVSASFDSTVRLWDLATGQELKRLVGHEGFFRKGMVNSVHFSPDGKYVLSGGSDNTLRLWEVKTGQLLRTFTGHTNLIYSVAFSPDGRLALSGSWDATVRLWNVATGETLKIFKGHSEGFKSAFDPGVYAVAFTPDNRYALSAGDASFRVWDIATGKEVAMMIAFEDGEWIVVTPEGYYNASANGHRYMKLLRATKSYGMEQFYDVFYRPDIVAAKLKGDDIRSLATLTMDDALRNPPPAVDFSSVPSKTDAATIKACYRVKGEGGGIGEVRVFHNGKLVQSDGYYKDIARSGTAGMQLASLNSKTIYEDMRSISIKGKAAAAPTVSTVKGELFDGCTEIEPVPGENEISIAAFNSDNTVQSYMRTIRFNSTRTAPEPHLYILAIGIDRYTDSTVNLKYAVKDATDMAEKLKTRSATLYQNGNIHCAVLKNDEATKAAITGRINQLAATIRPSDSFVLFVAGHGVLWQNQYYMLTRDYNGAVNVASMISSNEIVEMSKKIKSLSQLLIFDTCHAGGVDYIVSGLYDSRMSVLARKMGLHIYASA